MLTNQTLEVVFEIIRGEQNVFFLFIDHESKKEEVEKF